MSDEIDLFNCDPCGNTRKGYIIHADKPRETVPCWHCKDWFERLEINRGSDTAKGDSE